MEADEDPSGLLSMPGKVCLSLGQAEDESLISPRHWSMKAKTARARGRAVRSRTILDAKLALERVMGETCGLKGPLRLAMRKIEAWSM